MIRLGALVVYKDNPAVIVEISVKTTIRNAEGVERRVREKDILELHPGPVSDLNRLTEPDGEIAIAWEMLAGTLTTLRDLCELAFDAYTPGGAWAAWKLLQDGEYFEGTPDAIRAMSPAEVQKKRDERAQRLLIEERRRGLIDKIRSGSIEESDRDLFGEIEAVARGTSEHSRLLRDAGIGEHPDRAHSLLLRLGVWSPVDNPYPSRHSISLRSPVSDSLPVDSDDRRDLTHLEAFAIDDEGTTAADDAVSRDGADFWVHIADPASAILPGSSISEEAYARASTLHSPGAIAHMLPEAAIEQYSLGISEVSPALSFRFAMTPSGDVELLEIVPSRVHVERLSYESADSRLREPSLASIEEVTRSFHNWRQAHAAPSIQLPEARIRVVKGEVSVLPVQFGRSRDLVLESMLMVGYGVGRYSIEQGIPMPFSRQEQPELDSFPDTLATMWSARRRYKRSEHTTIPGGHAGLGLPVYIQSTSPLRRFLDLLAHQQLRTVLSGRPPLTSEEVTEYVGGSDIRSAEVKKVERLSDRHFVLAYLIQNPDWTGTGIVVSLGKTTTVVVPDLGLEADLVGRNRYELDDEIQLAVDSIRLPVLQCFFTEV